MSGADHLNKTLFHGTAHEFKPGEIVEPQDERGAFATTEIIDARYWAHKAMQSRGGTRGYVYEVQPVKPGDAKRYPGGLATHHSLGGFNPVRLVEEVEKPKDED